METFKKKLEDLYEEAKYKGIDCILCCSKKGDMIYKEHIESQIRFNLTQEIIERTDDPIECLLISMTNKRVADRLIDKMKEKKKKKNKN